MIRCIFIIDMCVCDVCLLKSGETDGKEREEKGGDGNLFA